MKQERGLEGGRGEGGRMGCYFMTGGWEVLFILFFFLRAAPVACGGSQTRGVIGAAAAGLHQSHSKARSELHL